MPLTTNIDFNDLLRILDGELRLITPTDPEGDSLSGDLSRNSSLATRFFQLTHDYLVPSLREWLTRKQKETRRGRAELKLAERSASWNAKPERRYLPTLIEWLYFRSFTSPANWSSNERRMMGNAKRILATTWLIGMASVSAIIIPSLHRYQSREREFVLQQVRTAVDAAANSRGVALPHSIRDLKQYPQSLVVDELKSRINNEDAFPNLGLTCALAEFGTVDSEFLVAQVDTVSDEDASNLLMALKSDSNAALKHLKLAASVSTENKQWEHKAKLSILALHLDDVEIVAEMCRVKGQSDLTQRSVFIDVFSRWDLDTYSLATLIDNDDQQDFRSGMCLAVGQMPVKYLSPKEIARWQDLAAQWYSRKSDAGTHSASVWLLRKLESVVPKVGSSSDAEILNDWYETTTGLTMLRIPDGESVYDPGTKVRSFWMCDREVSIANFELFLTDPDLTADEKPTKSPQAHSKTSPSIDHPVQQVSWYDAVLFCNWLSRKEGLDVAYKKIGKSNLPSVYQGRTSPDVWATDLRANGYRLPTTHEWMRACHADTVTTFSSGNDEVLQTQYAHFRASACLVCGEKMPNGFGLFDLEGNVSEWLTDDDVDREQIRQVGGGAFNRVVADQLVLLNTATAEDESYVIGFRPVRRN